MGANGNKEYVYAIDLKTRKKLWTVEVGALEHWLASWSNQHTYD